MVYFIYHRSKNYFIILNFQTMKHIITFATIILGTFISNFSFAQKSLSAVKTDTIQIWGNCESCQARIEKAAKSAGAEMASWNSETKLLVISYDDTKTSIKQIEKAIAKKGHDTPIFSANDADYKRLPACCQYERKGLADSSN